MKLVPSETVIDILVRAALTLGYKDDAEDDPVHWLIDWSVQGNMNCEAENIWNLIQRI